MCITSNLLVWSLHYFGTYIKVNKTNRQLNNLGNTSRNDLIVVVNDYIPEDITTGRISVNKNKTGNNFLNLRYY